MRIPALIIFNLFLLSAQSISQDSKNFSIIPEYQNFWSHNSGRNTQNNNKHFIENKGQWDKNILYLYSGNNINLWITKEGLVYDFYKIESEENINHKNPLSKSKRTSERYNKQCHAFKMQFIGVKAEEIKRTGYNKTESYYNYFIGKDKNKWASNVPLYNEVEIKELYDGINERFYFDGDYVRYDIIASPGSDLTKIRIKLEGDDGTSLNQDGELEIKTRFGTVTNEKIFAYQINNGQKTPVDCKFFIDNDSTVGFRLDNYDKSKELVIDPLIYSALIGDNPDNPYRFSIAADYSGNAYISGCSYSPYYPSSLGAYKTVSSGGDVFVSKLSSDGTNLIYSTFIGGGLSENSYGIAVDTFGNAYVGGRTSSKDFPVTLNAFDTTYSDSVDAFVCKLSPDGSKLLYSTYLGGSKEDNVFCIAVDKTGSAYVSGSTYSSDYPVTNTAFDKTYNGIRDSFITKLSPDGSYLEYSTFIGGSSEDFGEGLAVDRTGNAYLTGMTYSADFPMSSIGYDKSYNGGGDAFVVKLNQDGSALVYSTFIGGSGSDGANSISVDKNNNVYITGSTDSQDFPVSGTAYSKIIKGSGDVFVTKLNSVGLLLDYSTLLGGYNSEIGYAIAVDDEGYAYVAGNTNSTNFPVTDDASISNFSIIDGEAFLTKLNLHGSGLNYSTLWGGKWGSIAWSLALDGKGQIVMVGTNYSNDFPVTAGAYHYSYNNYSNIFVSKFDLSSPTVNVEETKILPASIHLRQNYPNPFNPTTKIEYNLSDNNFVSLKVYDVLGKELAVLVNEKQNPGKYIVEWTPKLAACGISSGVYFYRLAVGKYNEIRKMVLMK
jgi:hypothetical protein